MLTTNQHAFSPSEEATFKYLHHTTEDVAAMLKAIGVKSIDDLYTDVPPAMRFKGDYHLPSAKS